MEFLFSVVILHLLPFLLGVASFPEDWRAYVANEMLDKYDGKSMTGYSTKYFQGDIGSIDRSLPMDGLQGQLNNAINDERKRWPNGVVPFVLSEMFMEEDRRLEKEFILASMNSIALSTGFCVTFVPRKTQQDYVHIGRGMDCRSNVGRTGGRQNISLSRGCLEEIGAIQHELLHALGFYHENSRADRDDYVCINWKNLQPEAAKDFRIPSDAMTFGLPYDFDSVLHYRHNAFAINSSAPTIIPKQKASRIGQSASMSVLDIVKLKRAYHCPEQEYEKAIGRLPKTTTERSVTAARTTKTKLPLRLPEWKRTKMRDTECRSLRTNNCRVKSLAACRAENYLFYCDSFSTGAEVRFYLDQVKQVLPFSPIGLTLAGKRELKLDLFDPVSDNLVLLVIYNVADFDSSTLALLQLPNLLSLVFSHCTNVRLTARTLKFSNLRILTFHKSTIGEIERGSFESLISLKTIAFDQGLSPPFQSSTKDHLWRIHCSSEYRWLREYLKQHPKLTQPRKKEELFSVPGIRNFSHPRRAIYYPVNCANDDLTGDPYQLEFSLNAEE